MKRLITRSFFNLGLASLLGGCTAVEFVWAKAANLTIYSNDAKDGKGIRVIVANNFSQTLGPFELQCVFVTTSGVKLRKGVTVKALAPHEQMTIFPGRDGSGTTAKDGACRLSSGKTSELFVADENEKYWKLSGQ